MISILCICSKDKDLGCKWQEIFCVLKFFYAAQWGCDVIAHDKWWQIKKTWGANHEKGRTSWRKKTNSELTFLKTDAYFWWITQLSMMVHAKNKNKKQNRTLIQSWHGLQNTELQMLVNGSSMILDVIIQLWHKTVTE